MSIYSRIDYNQYFDNPVVGSTSLELLHLGNLNLPTGKIIACEPGVGFEFTKPYTKTVLPGNYPVIACIAKIDGWGDSNALVKLEFAKSRAVKWEMAIVDGQDINKLEDDWFFGYPVDSGLGCFSDVEAQEWYNKLDQKYLEEHPDQLVLHDLITAGLKKNGNSPDDPYDTGNWFNFYLPLKPDLNIMIFRSGYGGGSYPCYWGIAEDETICSLVVDFIVFPD